MPEKTEQILTFDEARELLRVSPATLYRLARTKRVPASRVGNQWRFSRAELERFIKDPDSFKGPKADA